MGEDCVSRDTVIAVLRTMCEGLGMALYVIDSHVILVKNGIPEVQALSDPVGRKVLGRLAGSIWFIRSSSQTAKSWAAS